MSRSLRVVSLNLRAYPNPSPTQINELASLIASHRPDIALVQECMRGWLPVIEEAAGLVGVHSHLVAPETPKRAFPPDGCAIAVRPPIQIESSRRVDPGLFRSEAVHAGIEDEFPVGFEDLPERSRSSTAELLCSLRSLSSRSSSRSTLMSRLRKRRTT